MNNNHIKVQFIGTNRLQPYKQDYLAIMDEISRSIAEIAINGKEKTNPILLLDGEPLIFPKTINLIQGKTGTHKSRLAEVLAASFLMKAPLSDVLRNVINPLAFTRLEYLSEYRVVYIDTERDYKELLPDTFNSIRTLSQIQDIDEFTSKFTMTSVLEISRTDRLDFIRVLLDRESKKFSKDEKTNLIVVLDVISDLTTNFNDIDSTYALSDFLTQMNNIYGVTFICVIHENPDAKSNKARGHLGTEISNKASRILQVALNGKKNTLDQLKITCLKSRNTAEFNPISAYYSPEHSRLIRFIPDETSVIKVANNIKASPNEVVQYLEEILEVGNDYKKSYLFPLLEKKFNVKARTIEDKLKVITDNLITFKINDDAYVLTTRVENKFKIYNLERKI